MTPNQVPAILRKVVSESIADIAFADKVMVRLMTGINLDKLEGELTPELILLRVAQAETRFGYSKAPRSSVRLHEEKDRAHWHRAMGEVFRLMSRMSDARTAVDLMGFLMNELHLPIDTRKPGWDWFATTFRREVDNYVPRAQPEWRQFYWTLMGWQS